ncbi:MAG TPA: nucleotidyltransferase [bacterium]|mgnify:CR=1 FL=1|nr:nucleotidyltransferase [bacterium]
MLEVKKDYKELLELLNGKKVEYLIVGAYALAFHGHPRFTGDIDIFVNSTDENARKIIEALNEFGFESLGLEPDDFQEPDNIIQLGFSPIRIDFLTSIDGVTWDEALNGSVTGTYGDIPVKYLGKNEFIKNKKASGRLKDLADIEEIAK